MFDAIIYLKYRRLQRWVSVINHALPRVQFSPVSLRVYQPLCPLVRATISVISRIATAEPPPVNSQLIYNVVLRCSFARDLSRITDQFQGERTLLRRMKRLPPSSARDPF